jgi:hypothetical protein
MIAILAPVNVRDNFIAPFYAFAFQYARDVPTGRIGKFSLFYGKKVSEGMRLPAKEKKGFSKNFHPDLEDILFSEGGQRPSFFLR